jgi:predicted TIM-barrel fold metal-dependent hydrolase
MSAKNYVIVSTDGHCGADLYGYKPYLPKRLHEQFDSWARTYHDPWSEFDTELDDFRIGVASYSSPVNWDSAKRQEYLSREGIAAEVLFPNTAPPFFPSGSIGAHRPGTAEDEENRYAGLQAHNRWLVDFCNDVPGRRAGIAQISLRDVDRAVEEIQWARNHGLRGILLPPDSMFQLNHLYYPRYERVWALCEELEMPIHRHAIVASEAASDENGYAGGLVGMFEIHFYTMRPLVHLILAGVFDRHPGLKVVFTEYRTRRLHPLMEQLDGYIHAAKHESTLLQAFGMDAAKALKRLPSEYLATNVYYGSFLDQTDIAQRYDTGLEKIMWGADFPHHEGTCPYTRLALQTNFSALPEPEVRQLTSLNAMEVYQLDSGFLQQVADVIGPTVEEIATPPCFDNMDMNAVRFCATIDAARAAAAEGVS